MRTLWMTALGLTWLATSASAQVVATFADLPLRLNIGDGVTVEDRSGAAVKGTVLRLTPDEIVIRGRGNRERTFAGSEVRRVQKRGDSLRNGLLWGAAVGAVGGCVTGGGFSGEWRSRDCLPGVLFFGWLPFGVILGGDALHVGTSLVFSAPENTANAVTMSAVPIRGGVWTGATLRW